MTISVVDAGPRRVSRSVEVAAPAEELFAIVADPRRHSEIDGSGTVRVNIAAPAKLAAGDRFSTKMRMFGLPYRITSTGDFADAHPGHRDVRLPRHGAGEGWAELLHADGFREEQRRRDRGHAGETARPLLPRLSSAVTSARACRTSASPSGRPPERCGAGRRSAA